MNWALLLIIIIFNLVINIEILKFYEYIIQIIFTTKDLETKNFRKEYF